MWQTCKPNTSKANETLKGLFGSEGRILEKKCWNSLGFEPIEYQYDSRPDIYDATFTHSWPDGYTEKAIQRSVGIHL